MIRSARDSLYTSYPPTIRKNMWSLANFELYFLHLANVLLKDKESARDNHVLTCNCAKLFTDLKKFTDRISFYIHLITNLPRNLRKKNLIGSYLTELWLWVCGPLFCPPYIWRYRNFLITVWDRWKEAFMPKTSSIRPVESIQYRLVTDTRRQHRPYTALA